jgi:signal transduction histidine kinase
LRWAFLEQLDALALDLTLRIRGGQSPDPRIVIVAIDDVSLHQIGRWPWPPEDLNQLLSNIRSASPRVLGLDILLAPTSESAYAFTENPAGIVLAAALGRSGSQGSTKLFWQQQSPLSGLTLGHIHADKDIDGICRSIPLSVSFEGNRHWAFSLQVVRLWTGFDNQPIRTEAGFLRVGSILIPRMATPIDSSIDSLGLYLSSAGDRLLINYRGGPGTFPYVAASEVLKGNPSALSKLRDRIVLVGATAYSLGDHLSTAFSAYDETPGVEIHANAIDTILNQRFIRTPAELTVVLLILLVATWTGTLFGRWAGNLTVYLIVATLLAALLVPPFLMLFAAVWIPWVTMLAAVIVPVTIGQLVRFLALNRQLNTQFQKLARLLLQSDRRVETDLTQPEVSLFRRQSIEWKISVLGEAGRNALNTAAVKEETLSFLSHELKTPLTSIQGFADLLLAPDELSSEDRKVSLDMIRSESSRLGTLINDYLDLARLEQGATQPHFQRCRLEDLVVKAAAVIHPHLGEKRIRLAGLPLATTTGIVGDPQLLTQVLVNLLSNAVKYSPSDTEVRVELQREPDQVILSVRDQGYGISEEDQKQLFRKFFRSAHAASADTPGSGLGLAFVKRVMDLHGGRIEVESELGQGSTFSVILARA